MKLLFISDIHGLKTNLSKVKEKFIEFDCDKLIVLGDLFYIGPRNMMNEDYDISYVKDFLNSFKDKIICIKGNCDSSVDSLVCEFPIISELGQIATLNKNLYLTHGHIYNEHNWPYKNTILIYGHLHIPFIKKIDTNIFINPGSISLPKNNLLPTYLYYDEESFTIYDIKDNIVEKMELK